MVEQSSIFLRAPVRREIMRRNQMYNASMASKDYSNVEDSVSLNQIKVSFAVRMHCNHAKFLQ